MSTAAPASSHHAPNAALLIDFDNVTMGIRSELQTELRNLLSSDIVKGKVSVRRAYADWRRYPQYIVPLAESSIDMIMATAYGSAKKNATDIRLAVDAMELVFTRPEIGTFILLSGDSDFASLVTKLKEYSKYVIGVGIRESSSDLLVMNCDEYYSYNALAGLVRSGEEEVVKKDPWELVTEAVSQMKRNGDVMRADRLKQVMQQIDSSFDEKNLGMSKFSRFVTQAAACSLSPSSKTDSSRSLSRVLESPAASPPAKRARPRGSHRPPTERRRSARAADEEAAGAATAMRAVSVRPLRPLRRRNRLSPRSPRNSLKRHSSYPRRHPRFPPTVSAPADFASGERRRLTSSGARSAPTTMLRYARARSAPPRASCSAATARASARETSLAFCRTLTTRISAGGAAITRSHQRLLRPPSASSSPALNRRSQSLPRFHRHRRAWAIGEAEPPGGAVADRLERALASCHQTCFLSAWSRDPDLLPSRSSPSPFPISRKQTKARSRTST